MSILFILSSIYIYIKNLKKMAFALESDFLAIEESETHFEVPSDSNFTNIFCENLVKIIDLNDSTLIGQNYKFKHRFIQRMYDESNTLKVFFEKLINTRRTEISYWKTYKKSLGQRIIDVAFCFPSS